MAGNCSICGQWLDDVESATVPQDKCWDHKNRAGTVEDRKMDSPTVDDLPFVLQSALFAGVVLLPVIVFAGVWFSIAAYQQAAPFESVVGFLLGVVLGAATFELVHVRWW